MKSLVPVFLALLLASVVSASDENLSRGIPGRYVRAIGMESTVIDLRRDGVYVITIHGCLASEEEGRGRWSIRDGTLLLDRSGDRKEKRVSLSRFEIVVVDGDIALKSQDEVASVEDSETDSLLFRHQKQTANQPSEPTSTSVTICADAQLAPAAVVAHL